MTVFNDVEAYCSTRTISTATLRTLDTAQPGDSEASCEYSQGERPSGRAGSGLVRQPWRSERYSGLPKKGEVRPYLFGMPDRRSAPDHSHRFLQRETNRNQRELVY